MNGDGVVEIPLGGAHADGDGETLQDLVGGFTQQVQADDLLLAAGADQLHQAALLTAGQRAAHRPEAAAIDADIVAEALARLSFRHANGADGRMREHHGRDVGVVEPTIRLVTEQAIHQPT